MNDEERFVWLASHLHAFRLEVYNNAVLEWIDDYGRDRVTAVSSEEYQDDAEFLRMAVDAAMR